MKDETIYFSIGGSWRERTSSKDLAHNDPIDNGNNVAMGTFRSMLELDQGYLEYAKSLKGRKADMYWRGAGKDYPDRGYTLETLAALTWFEDFRPEEIAQYIPQAAAKANTKIQSEIITSLQIGMDDRFKSARFQDLLDPAYPFVFALAGAYYNPYLLDGVKDQDLLALSDQHAAFIARRIGMSRLTRYVDVLKKWKWSELRELKFWAHWALMMMGQDQGSFAAYFTSGEAHDLVYKDELEAIEAAQGQYFISKSKAVKILIDGRQKERLNAAYSLALSDKTLSFMDVYSLGPVQLAAIKVMALRYGQSVEL